MTYICTWNIIGLCPLFSNLTAIFVFHIHPNMNYSICYGNLKCTHIYLYQMHIQATTTTTVPPVIVVCAGASTVTLTVAIAFTSLGLSWVPYWDNEFPPSPLIPLDTTKVVNGFTAMPLQQPPYEMDPQDRLQLSLRLITPWFLYKWVFFFRD